MGPVQIIGKLNLSLVLSSFRVIFWFLMQLVFQILLLSEGWKAYNFFFFSVLAPKIFKSWLKMQIPTYLIVHLIIIE